MDFDKEPWKDWRWIDRALRRYSDLSTKCVETKMEKVQIENEKDLYIQLPRKNRGFVKVFTFGNFSMMKCYRGNSNVKAYCEDGRFFVEKDAHHTHDSDDKIIAAKIHSHKMHNIIENTKKLLVKRQRNDSTEEYIKNNIIPKVNDFENNLWQKLGMFGEIVHAEVIKTYEKIYDGFAKPFIDSIKSSLQDLNLNKDDSLIDVKACKELFFNEIMTTKSSFLREVKLLYKNVYNSIIPKHMASLQEKLTLLVGKIGSTLITSFGGGCEVSAKKAKS